MKLNFLLSAIGIAVSIASAPGFANVDVDWEMGIEYRYLPQDPPYEVQDNALSTIIRADHSHDLNDGSDLLEFEGFYRWSDSDKERIHGDFENLSWTHVANSWEIRSGVRTVFWGVSEFQHLVDVINQKDLVERIDGEARLGQPMINLSLIREWGIMEIFALVGFRKRTYPGEDGWPRGPILISNDYSEYESGQEENRTDFALRWSNSINSWDVALSYFSGNSRDPEFRSINDKGELIPFYAVIDQQSLELQYNHEEWLWKLEALSRSGLTGGRYFATTFGFEYNIDFLSNSTRAGLLMEYNFDERGNDSPFTQYLENDLALGLRWVLNDEASTELLFGAIIDEKTHEKAYPMQVSSRMGEFWKINFDANFFVSKRPPTIAEFLTGSSNPEYKLASQSRNDLLQLELIRYF